MDADFGEFWKRATFALLSERPVESLGEEGANFPCHKITFFPNRPSRSEGSRDDHNEMCCGFYSHSLDRDCEVISVFIFI